MNPAGVSPDDSRSAFSLQGIHDMVGESLAAWEKHDVEEALRRDAAHCARRRLTPKDPDAAAVCAPVVVAARGSELVGDDDAHGGRQKGRDGAPTGALHGAGGQSALCTRPVGGQCPPAPGPLTRMAADFSWTTVFGELYARGLSTFISGGPGVGKTSFLRCFAHFLRSRMRADGAVVVVAPTGSAAKTAEGVTYHSFFGFVKDYKMSCDHPAQEARRLLALDRWKPIARRLAKVEVLLVDEISMVPADNLDVMCEMLRQCRASSSPPVVIYSFGDFLQLRPMFGQMAFLGKCWASVFGDGLLELTRVHRQDQPDFVAALHDARFGRCTEAVQKLMDECTVTDEAYASLKCSVLHLIPRHEDVSRHNMSCLMQLRDEKPRPKDFVAVDCAREDPNRDRSVPRPDTKHITAHSRDAALMDCVAPRVVQHCRGARVMLTSNHFLSLGLYHGSIGKVVSYTSEGVPIVRFDDHDVVEGTRSNGKDVWDAGANWLEMLCPPVEFESRILSCPGAVAVRLQVPFVLGWGITVHRSQSLTLSEAVLEVGKAFGAGMVLAAISRVPDKGRMHVRSFCGSRLIADPDALRYYQTSPRL